MFTDPVRTRGYPLKNNIHINSQSALSLSIATPMGNATFSYGIQVTQGFFTFDQIVSHWIVVDGDGRELDFGPTTSAPAAAAGIFSELIFNPTTGFVLRNANEPEHIEDAGNFTYNFDQNGRLTSLVDPEGNIQSIIYNASLKPLVVTDQSSNKTLTFGYNTSGLINTVTENGAGAITELSYTNSLLSTITVKDNQGNIVRNASVTYNADGAPITLTKDNDPATTLTFTHAKAGHRVYLGNITDTVNGNTNFNYAEFPVITNTRRTSQTNTRGGVTYYDYDLKGDLVSVTLPGVTGATQSVKFDYTYNADHNLTSVTDGITTYTLTYTANGLLSSITNNLGEFRNYQYNGADLLKITDNIGTILELGYRDTNNPHSVTFFKDGSQNQWSRTLNQFGQTLTISAPRGSPQGITQFKYEENPSSFFYGYLRLITNGAKEVVTIDGYSALGDILSISTYPSAVITNTHSFTYDASQRITGYIAPDGKNIDFNYTGKDLTSINDEAHTVTTYEYCPSCSQLKGVHAALGKNLAWNLDGDKNTTKFIDPKLKETDYTYGTANELKRITYPADIPGGNFIHDYTYNNVGRLRTIAKTGIPAATFGYDAASRLNSIDYPGTNPSDSSYEYNLDGSLKKVTDDIGTATYLYNASRLVASVTYNYSPHLLMQSQVIEYVYNKDNSLSLMSWKSAGVVVASWNYSYDLAGKLKTVSNNFSESLTYTYDKEGKVLSEIRGNTTSRNYQYYQPRGWPNKITEKLGVTPFADYTIQYDNGNNTVGNITKVTELDGSIVDYTYDALYRLTSESRSGTNSYPSRVYTYDLSGNITDITIGGMPTAFATYTAANDVASIAGGVVNNFQGRLHDYSGSMIPGGTFSYEDDSNLRAQSIDGVNSTNYKTDGLGRRVLKFLSPNNQHVFYIFDGDRLIGEIDRNGVPQVAYTWGRDGLFSERLIPSSQSRYYHFGPQGETRHLTNAAGAVTDSYVYEAYGKAVAITGTSYNPHRYGGKYGYFHDGLNGHLLVGRRWYSTYLMRWFTHDPIGYEGGTNLYEYVGGNPIRYVDPSGLTWQESLNYFWHWLIGQKMPNYFGPKSNQVQDMKDAPGVRMAREAFYEKNKDVSCGNWQSLANYKANFGLTGLFEAGLNPTRQFIGKYRIDISPNLDGSINISLTNTTSFTSFAYGLGPNWEEGPGGNQTQIYEWTEFRNKD